MVEPDGVGVVLHKDRKVLLQKRDSRPKLFPNYWVLFGGQIKEDERPAIAACREIEEELEYNIDLTSLHYLGAVRVLRDSDCATMHYFSIPFLSNLSELKLHEGDGLAYFHQEELHLLQMRPEDRLALDKHFHGLGFGWIT